MNDGSTPPSVTAHTNGGAVGGDTIEPARSMQAPARLTVPTCIGCVAMGRPGTCDTTCTERKLELVRAASHDWVVDVGSRARAQLEDFGGIADELARRQPAAEELESAYRSLQVSARTTLRRYPEADEDDADLQEPAEPATTWWCPECGGIDAPQPCLGICIWRPIEWVNRAVYDRERERALADHEAAVCLRRLLRRVAAITPRDGQWDRTWRLLRAEAQQTLESDAAPVPEAAH